MATNETNSHLNYLGDIKCTFSKISVQKICVYFKRLFKKNHQNVSFLFSIGSQQEKYIFCNPCSNDDEKVKATHFCETCEDPEPFCGSCAKQHTRQKKFREHQLCGKIRNFSQHLKKIGYDIFVLLKIFIKIHRWGYDNFLKTFNTCS